MKFRSGSDTTSTSTAGIYRSIAYSLPHISMAWLVAPIAILQGVYAKYYGLALTTIATVLLVAKLFNAITDPIIGYCSDRYHERTGTRKPFILIGSLLCIVSSYFLYVPPDDVTAWYFAAWLLAFYLAWTLVETPHLVWGGEIARDSVEKTKIYSVRAMAGYAGLLSFYTIPLLPLTETSNINPETLRISVIAACAWLIFPSLYFCLKTVPDGHGTHVKPRQRESLNLMWQLLMSNKPYLLFIGAYFFSGFGAGLWYGLIFIYVDVYLNMGEQFAKIFLLAFIVGLMVTPFWYRVASRIGKKSTWAIATVLFLSTFLYTGTITPDNASLGKLVALKIFNTISFTCFGILAPSMLSDIVDYGTLKLGVARGATYFSLYTFIAKANTALASSLALAIVGWYGFDAAASVQTEQGIWGLKLAISWLPPVFCAIALIFIFLTPITEHRHAIIRRRLNAREVRAKRSCPG